MLSIGFRDLNVKQIVNLLLGKLRLAPDSKALREFSATVQQIAQTTDSQSNLKKLQEFATDEEKFVASLLSKSVKLSLVLYSLQERARLSSSAFIDSIELFNAETANIPSKFWEKSSDFNSFAASAASPVLFRAALLADYLLLRLLTRFSKIETCLYIETNGIDHSFLADIEKNFAEDRQIVKTVRLFGNYFKRAQRAKGAVPDSLVEEVLRTSSIDGQMDAFARTLIALLSFEKKPELNGALLLSNTSLSAFAHGAAITRDSLLSAFAELDKAKKATRKDATPSRSRFGLLIDELLRCQELIQSKSETDRARKASESFELLRGLHNPARGDVQKLSDNFDLGFFLEAASCVLAPLVERLKKPKAPKGTQDCLPTQMVIKREAIDAIKQVYLNHGAVEIDTPVFELRETLLGKYGDEGGKLIYDLEDQGGEMLSLRYDLTVPFARFMACHSLQKLKRFHIGKVYRRDQPNMNRGRFREFYQCDFDIVGRTGTMVAEAEVLQITAEILAKMRFDRLGTTFKIKVSHRELLEAIVVCAGCDVAKFKAICSSIDKLDKEPWAAVEKELVEEKGLLPEQCAKIQSLVSIRGPVATITAKLRTNELLAQHPKTAQVLNEMEVLHRYLSALEVEDKCEFDLSLARGLDYYTGLIYEAVLEGTAVGSIAGGGRYDELIGMFSAQKLPAVGVSIGIERVFTLFEEKFIEQYRPTQSQVLVCTIGKDLVVEKLKLLRQLWANEVAAETLYDDNPKPDKQLKAALEAKIPFLIWIGENELARGVFKIKDLEKKTEEEVKKEDAVARIRELIAQLKK